ncbi:MAG: ABC transporter permease [Muribaculaceae bacterium]|nr:ABC transporter permease [Muribaculaceae bacterium]
MLALKIALRYLFSKKTHNAVNIITAVASACVTVATAAIVIILSVFNGFTKLAESKLSKFDAPLRIERSDRRLFPADSVISLLPSEGIKTVIPIIETKAFAQTTTSPMLIELIGAPKDFLSENNVDAITIDGVPFVGDTLYTSWGMASVGVALGLEVRPGDGRSVKVMIPRRNGRINPSSMISTFRTDSLYIAGVYQAEDPSVDNDILLVDIEMVRALAGYEDGYVSSLNLYPSDGRTVTKLKESLQMPGFRVMDIHDQNSESFNMIAMEKWMSFALLAFILLIASFNVISTLTILIIEKKNNMFLLSTMGASGSMIRNVFLWEGVLVSFVGGLAGCILGLLLSLGQQHFGWIKLSSDIDVSMLSITTYPVSVEFSDLIAVIGLIVILSLLTTFVSLGTAKNDKEE